MNTTLTRPRIDGRTTLAGVLARQAHVKRYQAHARARALECGDTMHGRIWRDMAKDYGHELRTLAGLIARKQERKTAAASA